MLGVAGRAVRESAGSVPSNEYVRAPYGPSEWVVVRDSRIREMSEVSP